MLSFLFFACSTETTVSGTVQDIWSKPIEEAEVYMKDVEESTKTSSSGSFSFSAKEGNMSFRIAKEGYIPNTGQVSYKKGEADPSLTIQLYPTAEKNGFWYVGEKNYQQVDSQKIFKKESNARRILGLYDVGSIKIKKTKPAFVFRTTLRKEQLSQLDLELHSLRFIDKTTFTSLTGPKEVDIDLWVPDTQAAFDIRKLGANDHFLIELREELQPGVYAFHSQDVLSDEANINTKDLPKELLMGFPFEVK